MNTSSLLQTEMLGVPTQLIFIDVSASSIVKKYVHQTSQEFVNILEYPVEEDFLQQEEGWEVMKQMYIKNRPLLISSFCETYDDGIKRGTKGRVVIWVVGNLNNEYSSLLLTELCLDLSNFCHWRYKFVPGILRVALTHHNTNDLIKRFMEMLSVQYFELPQFNVRKDIETIKQSLNDQGFDITSSSNNVRNQMPFTLHGNPYDVTLLFNDEMELDNVLKFILKLHVLETNYISKNKSNLLGSGGQLYLVENKIISSYSAWRRLDWLTLAQTEFMPRLWWMTRETTRLEFYNLFDYRQWRGRFTHLFEEETLDESELEKLIISYPDSKAIDLYLRDDGLFQRRRRERNWNRVMATMDNSSSSQDPMEVNFSQESIPSFSDVEYSIGSEEANVYRITTGDIPTFNALVHHFQRDKKYLDSMEVVDMATTSLKVDDEMYKLKGISLLNLGHDKEGSEMLKNYRSQILENLKDAVLLGKGVDDIQRAQAWSEVAAVALIDNDHHQASVYSRKALEILKDNIGTLKTFLWASVVEGITSCEEMDIIFSFFMNHLRNMEKAKEYYQLVLEKHPQNGYFLFGFAMFLYLQGDFLKADEMFQKALMILPECARLLESYASFLVQTQPIEVKKEAIMDMYKRSLEIEPRNLVTKTNLCGFLLLVGENSQGLSILEEVLYAEDLFLKNPQIYLEAWYYAFCYIDNPDKRYESLRQLKFALIKGMRAPLWDLSIHVPYYKIVSERDWVRKLAQVIQSEKHINELVKWERWAKTPSSNLMKSTPSSISVPNQVINQPSPSSNSSTFPTYFSRKKSDLESITDSKEQKDVSESTIYVHKDPLIDDTQGSHLEVMDVHDIFAFDPNEAKKRQLKEEDVPKPKKVFSRKKSAS